MLSLIPKLIKEYSGRLKVKRIMRDLIDRGIIRNALNCGVICTLICLPNLYYLCFIGLREMLLEKLTTRMLPGLMLFHVWGILISSFMCSLFGLAWSRKYGLGGIGDFMELKRVLLKLALIGLIFAVVSLFTFDRYFSIKLPYLYPSHPIWILSIILKSVSFNEIIRFGMMALVGRLTKNTLLANIIVSIFFVYLGIRSFYLLGLEFDLSYFSISCVIWSLLFNLFLGYLYARFGIISTMFIQFVVGLRLFALTLLY